MCSTYINIRYIHIVILILHAIIIGRLPRPIDEHSSVVRRAESSGELTGAVAAALMIKVRHAGVTYDIELHHDGRETLHERLSRMFSIPRHRMQLIHKGKKLADAESVAALVHPNMTIQLIGSREEHYLPPPPGPIRTALAAVFATLSQTKAKVAALVSAPPSLSIPSRAGLWQFLCAAMRGIVRFFVSLVIRHQIDERRTD